MSLKDVKMENRSSLSKLIGQAVSQQVVEIKNPLFFFKGSYWDTGELLGKYEGSRHWLSKA